MLLFFIKNLTYLKSIKLRTQLCHTKIWNILKLPIFKDLFSFKGRGRKHGLLNFDLHLKSVIL